MAIDPLEVPETPKGQRSAKERRLAELDAAHTAAGDDSDLAAGRSAAEVRAAKRASDPVREAVTPKAVER
jgi:hypothetical protein